MADFESAIKILLDHEGGYANNPNDPGGATKYGLSSRYLQNGKHTEFDLNHDGNISPAEVKGITENQAINVYKTNWWDVYGYDRIKSDKIAAKLFDSAINFGQKTAVKLMQNACNKIYGSKRIAEDGVMGPITTNAINEQDELRLIGNFRLNCANRYRKLVEANPNLQEFAYGWLKRAMS